MISMRITTMGPHDDHARRVVVARSNDHHERESWAIAVVIGVRVAMVIRSADHKLSGEVDANPRLGRRDAGSETKQESDDNEDAFHGCLLGVDRLGKRRAMLAIGSK